MVFTFCDVTLLWSLCVAWGCSATFGFVLNTFGVLCNLGCAWVLILVVWICILPFSGLVFSYPGFDLVWDCFCLLSNLGFLFCLGWLLAFTCLVCLVLLLLWCGICVSCCLGGLVMMFV